MTRGTTGARRAGRIVAPPTARPRRATRRQRASATSLGPGVDTSVACVTLGGVHRRRLPSATSPAPAEPPLGEPARSSRDAAGNHRPSSREALAAREPADPDRVSAIADPPRRPRPAQPSLTGDLPIESRPPRRSAPTCRRQLARCSTRTACPPARRRPDRAARPRADRIRRRARARPQASRGRDPGRLPHALAAPTLSIRLPQGPPAAASDASARSPGARSGSPATSRSAGASGSLLRPVATGRLGRGSPVGKLTHGRKANPESFIREAGLPNTWMKDRGIFVFRPLSPDRRNDRALAIK